MSEGTVAVAVCAFASVYPSEIDGIDSKLEAEAEAGGVVAVAEVEMAWVGGDEAIAVE